MRRGGTGPAPCPPCCTVILGLLLLLPAAAAPAFEQETQTWITSQLVAPLGESTALGLRYRTRFSGFFEKRSLYQYQAILGHQVSEVLRVDAGYELFRAAGETLEHRYFPQVQLRSSLGGLPFRQRLRLEVRDIVRRDEPALRLRYLVGHQRKLTDSGAYLELRNELFVSLSEGEGIERGFVQNRVGATLGQRLGQRWRTELRYQWGYIDNAVLTRGDHLIQFLVVWDGR
jgi:hypothetical protein